jgi:hypothetical protein
MHESMASRVRAAGPVLLGLLGGALVAFGTRLPWYWQRDDLSSGFGTGMGDHGQIFAWLGLLVAAAALGAEVDRRIAILGVLAASIVLALAWFQLVQVHGQMVAVLGPGRGEVVNTGPLEGTWLLVLGAVLAITGSGWRLVRR